MYEPLSFFHSKVRSTKQLYMQRSDFLFSTAACRSASRSADLNGGVSEHC